MSNYGRVRIIPAKKIEHLTSFLIVHGWQNRRPPEHWQHWLDGQLRARGHQVIYPQMPEPDHPRPAEWTQALRDQLELMRHTRRVVICHSLGCMAWLHLAAATPRLRMVDQLVFVAPPSADYLASQPELADFRPPRQMRHLLRMTCHAQPRLVCSGDDPYCKRGAHREYPGMFEVDLIPGAGHLDIPAGYGPWPSLLEWCADPASTIGASDRDRSAMKSAT